MSEPITDAELDAIRARTKAATPGPWTYSMSGDLGTKAELRLIVRRHLAEPLGTMEPNWIPGNADMSFIKNAREAVPALLDEVERLRTQLAAIREKAGPIIEFEKVTSMGAGQPQDWQIDLTDSGARLTASGLRALADALKELP